MKDYDGGYPIADLVVHYRLAIVGTGGQPPLPNNHTRYDPSHAGFSAFWQYACVIAWATEKSVKILDECCILPKLASFK